MHRKNAVIDLGTYRVGEATVVEDRDDWRQNLPPGTELLLGQYRITGYLNCGGFGITYLAKDSLGRTVVVKECFPSEMCYRSGRAMAVRTPKYRDELASVVRHFVGEAHRLASLRHDNIVHVHQIFEENDTAYIAMDFIDGPDLLDIIEDGPKRFSPKEIVALTRKVLGAVKYLHDRGMLHRDISPDNILIGADGEPVLIDFGAAREHARASQRALSKLKFVKDGYSPQEFYLAGSEQGTWSDLYSLAASLYHLISGEVPADGQARIAALATKKPDPYVPLSGCATGYPSRFLKALDKAMAVLPQDRIQTADEWLDMISGGGGHDLVRSRYVPAAVDLFAKIPAGGADLRAFSGKRAVALAAGVACVAVVSLSAVRTTPTAPVAAGAEETPLASVATGDAGIAQPFDVTVVLDAPPAAPMPELPVATTQAPRIVKPGTLPAPNPPAEGSAQVRPPEGLVAPPIELATAAPTSLDETPNHSLPDLPAASLLQPVAFHPPAPPDRPSLQTRSVAPARTPRPGEAATVPASGEAAPHVALRVAALPGTTVDRLALRPGLPPTPRKGIAGHSVAWSRWDIRMPFEEALVRKDGTNTIRIASVGPQANLAASGDWIAAGVEIDAVNGVPLQRGMTLADHFLSALATDADGYVRASVRHRDPVTGKTSQGTLAVQVVRETQLSDGTVLVTAKENRSWITRVEIAGAGSTLNEGDILIGEVFTSTAFKSHQDIAQSLAALSRNGVERAAFTVLRDGKRQMVGWSLSAK